MRPVPGPHDLLLRTRSIHTFGMRAPIGWIAFDAGGRVLRAGVVPPRRVVVVLRARFILEHALVVPTPDC